MDISKHIQWLLSIYKEKEFWKSKQQNEKVEFRL